MIMDVCCSMWMTFFPQDIDGGEVQVDDELFQQEGLPAKWHLKIGETNWNTLW